MNTSYRGTVGVVVYVNLSAIASRLLDQFLGITDREKELRHRYDLIEEETAELVAMEDAREAERQRKYQEERQRRLAGK